MNGVKPTRETLTADQYKDGIYILNYDPTDSPMEHDVYRHVHGEWFFVGHGLSKTFRPNDDDTFTRLVVSRG